ncbi:hypothetical protein KY285_009349 [Solanum tuberosum]|nr:hypothetical protein KY285_009349 [Solanum tuberosum]
MASLHTAHLHLAATNNLETFLKLLFILFIFTLLRLIIWTHSWNFHLFKDNNDIERDDEEDEIHEILRDLYPNLNEVNMNTGGDDFIEEEPNPEAKQFYSHLKDFEQPIYEGSKASKLSTLVKLLHIKSIGKWSNASFTMLLKILKEDLLPDGSNLPSSYYNAKKIIRELGFSYQNIDACKNNCMLYWKDDALLESCKVCGTSRWKEDKRNRETKFKRGKKIPCKILHYFPLKTGLQRLFMSSKTSSLMRWHRDERVDDGIMRHPADSVAWKILDELHPSFATELRNVRLGLASDGFQPFKSAKTPHNIWPVVLIPYNLPPWLCMKQENFILSMLIPGPESPGDAIDVYLQPLIEELKELWETDVKTFDASSRQNFMLHASLLWTINDFPAYENLSGWSTKGKLACPCCNKETPSIWLKNGNKQCYMRHRRFLPRIHKWRNDKDSFAGTKEHKLPPKMLSEIEWNRQFISWLQIKVEMNPAKFQNSQIGSNFKTKMQACILPGALARGRGKSLKSMGFKRVMAEETTPIGQNKNLKASTYQKDPAHNVIVVPSAFDPIEDDGPLSPEVEVMQDIQTNEISPRESAEPKKLEERTSVKMLDDSNQNNWRGSLHRNVKSKTFRDALKDVPKEVDKGDWEWLVKEHFLSHKFNETSTRNSVNRSKLSMPHRTGSKPIRGIIYELGGKDGKPPNMDTIFFKTRKKDNKLVEPETNAKYVEIQKLVQYDSSLTNIEVVKKCFGPQRKSHVIGFGGGITAKELKGGNSSKAGLLDKLSASEKENELLKKHMDELENICQRMDEFESKYEQLASVVFGEPTSPPSSTDQ